MMAGRLCTALLAFCLAGAAQADQRARASELLEMWQPQSVAIEDGVLKVVLPQDRISEEIYFAVLTAGLCLGFAMEKPLNGLSGVEVLNRHVRQGYVFERGLEDCDSWNERPAGSPMTRLEILGATHLY